MAKETIGEKETDKPKEMPAGRANISSLLQGPNNSNLPAPVRNVLENPSPETGRAYVAWSRQANEKLARASEYIARATREMNQAPTFGNGTERINNFAIAGLGPVGLYYFFSPSDRTAPEDIAVLNKIFLEGRIGVVGIPIRAKDEEIVQFLNEAKPLFPIRKSDAEVRLIKPSETPELYLALPLEKNVVRLGSTITETAIAEAIGSIVSARTAPALW